MPVALYVEFLTPAPYIDRIIESPFQLDEEGCLHVPSGPGLGIELNRDALEEFSSYRT
jgi:L-alanine-DL-glutamate epimerase-like enolase superfamily enzyme